MQLHRVLDLDPIDDDSIDMYARRNGDDDDDLSVRWQTGM